MRTAALFVMLLVVGCGKPESTESVGDHAVRWANKQDTEVVQKWAENGGGSYGWGSVYKSLPLKAVRKCTFVKGEYAGADNNWFKIIGDKKIYGVRYITVRIEHSKPDGTPVIIDYRFTVFYSEGGHGHIWDIEER